MSFRYLPAFSALALGASAAFAQTSAKAPDAPQAVIQTPLNSLNPVVVSAARFEQPLSDVIPSVSVISRQEIERSQALDLASFLSGEPGFEISRNGGPGATTSLFLRGMSSVNSAVFIDGVRAQTDRIGFFNFADIPLSIIDRIEIVRGNVGSLFGEAAIGGVINIFTRQNSGPPKSTFSITAGARNTRGLSANYGGDSAGYRFNVGVSALDTDGFSARVGSGFNPDNDGYSNRSVNARISRDLTQSTQVGMFMTAMAGQSSFDESSAPTDTHLLKRDNENVGIYAEMKTSGLGRTRIEIYHSRLALREFRNGAQRSLLDGGLSKGDQTTMRFETRMSPLKSTVLTGGAEISQAEFLGRRYTTTYIESNSSRETKAIYAGLAATRGITSFQLNLRNDHISAEERGARSVREGVTSWLTGVGFQLSENLRATASRSTAFRAPAPDEFVSSIGLRPEKHQSNELGLTYQSSNISARIINFSTSSRDAIVYRSDTFNYENINIENQGWESSVRAVFGKIEAKASYTVQDPRNVTVSNTRLARRANDYGSLQLSVVEGRLSYGGRFFTAGSRKDSDFNTVILAPYATLDLYARYQLTPEFGLGARVENVGNASYQLANTYATPSRGVFFTAQVRPKSW
ncbi:MAG: TonB-dependent receptor [Betaproteobacteria bacterium]|jgi:vitamin B12 transporter|nr:TonB-dependent receptor [Betaproteobacteria bacterium]